MQVYVEKNFFNHIDCELIKKLTNCYFDLSYIEDGEFVENSLFISLGFFLFEPTIELKEKIRNIKNKRIVIFHQGKSLSEVSLGMIYSFKKFLDDLKFDEKNTYIITQLKYDTRIIANVFSDVHVLNYDRWLYEFVDYHLLLTNFQPIECLHTVNYLQLKKFSIFCKRYTKDRFAIYCNLLSNNLLKEFNYTFVCENGPDLSILVDQIDDRFEATERVIKEWISGIPYHSKRQIHDSLQQHPHYPYELKNYFESSYIHVSLETEPMAASFLTEKTYRAIFYKKPFIIISQHNALKMLREEGYKTFSPMIDESYDDITDYEERVAAIIKELKRLNDLTESEIHQIVDECEDIVEHNFKVFYENAFRPIPENFKFKSLLTF